MTWNSHEDIPDNITSESALTASLFKSVRTYGSSFFEDETLDKTKGLTQQEAADGFELSKSAYAKLEAGDVTISFKHILKLCKLVQIKRSLFLDEFDRIANDLEERGIEIVEEKLADRFDCVKWEEKKKTKITALINKTIKAIKKDKSYYALNEHELAQLIKDLEAQAIEELENTYTREDAFIKSKEMNK